MILVATWRRPLLCAESKFGGEAESEKESGAGRGRGQGSVAEGESMVSGMGSTVRPRKSETPCGHEQGR